MTTKCSESQKNRGYIVVLKIVLKKWKKVLTFVDRGGIIILAPLIQRSANSKRVAKQKSFEKNLKKVVDKSKTAWYNKQAVAEKDNSKEPWELKIEQYTDPENSKNKGEGIRPWVREEFRTKPSKTGKIKQLELILTGQTINKRVWSWLRMNAGGVLNTCKSSEANQRKFSDGIRFDWAADGWVTRG